MRTNTAPEEKFDVNEKARELEALWKQQANGRPGMGLSVLTGMAIKKCFDPVFDRNGSEDWDQDTVKFMTDVYQNVGGSGLDSLMRGLNTFAEGFKGEPTANWDFQLKTEKMFGYFLSDYLGVMSELIELQSKIAIGLGFRAESLLEDQEGGAR